MTNLIARSSPIFWFVIIAFSVGTLLAIQVAFGVYGVQSAADLRKVNQEQFAQLSQAREERAALSAAIAQQRKAINKANDMLARAGEPGVGRRGPRGESAYPFAFEFEIDGNMFTVNCYAHTSCDVTKETK